jgi:signal transduction histidine kinase
MQRGTGLLPLSTLLTIGGSVALAVVLYRWQGTRQYINEPVHATVEAIGGCIALGMAVILVRRWLEDGPSHLMWTATSLLSMGTLDLTHACTQPGPAFFWSRALPTLVGGVVMALVWLRPSKRTRGLHWTKPPLIAVILTLPLSTLLVLLPDAWPNAFASDGSYHAWAKLPNVAGGLGFAVAAFFYLDRNRKLEQREADLVFGNHSVIFALAGFLFGLSHIWGPVWWLFHLLRLLAYAIVLKYSVDIYQRTREERELLRQVDFERRVVGIVSHDLRNPLSTIQLAAQVMSTQALPEKATTIVQRVASNAERMSRMITDLLDYSQSRLAGRIPLQRSDVELASLCEAVRQEFEHSHPNVTIACDSCADARGSWDSDRLHQVLANLIDNAIKHGDNTKPVTIRLQSDATRVRLEIHNHGAPIEPDVLPHIFEPFRSAARDEAKRKSFGLGLYIVHEIVRAHDGDISVVSNADTGTTFRISLPRNQR